MLRRNGSNFDRIRPLGGTLLARGGWRVARRQELKENFSGFGQDVSMPQGYQSAARAIIPTLQESGNIAVAFRGLGTFAAQAYVVESMAVAFSGEGTFSPNAQHAVTLYVNFQGEGNFAITPKQLEQMSITFDSGVRPSAFDIAQEVWQGQAASYNAPGTMGEKVNDAGSASNPWTEVIESGYTAAQILRILAAVAAGSATDLEGNPSFTGLDGTTERVAGTISSGTRTITTLDGS